jgi:hypothetical protein
MMSNYVITYKKKKYAFDLEAIKKLCFLSDAQKGKETEIVESYKTNNMGILELTSKDTKEIKGSGNPQNDMIIYDIVKLLMTALLSNSTNPQIPYEEDEEEEVEVDFIMDFSTALSFNTCIMCGILVEVK